MFFSQRVDLNVIPNGKPVTFFLNGMYFTTASRNVLVISEWHLQAFAKNFSLRNPYC